MSHSVPTTYCGLPVYRLVDVLKYVPLPPNCPFSGVSSKWHCVIAPKIREGECEEIEESLPYFDAGIPCRLPRHRSAPAHKICGEDAFDFIFDPRWNQFPRPKIAFKAGWAGPGTAMESNAYHKMIGSFAEVIHHKAEVNLPGEDEEAAAAAAEQTAPSAASSSAMENVDDVAPQEILNLQMFHRSDPGVDPLIPILSEKLLWPELLEESAVCDNATRVSQRGAITWWHLDDSGEFVMQTGLPLKKRVEQHIVPRPVSSSSNSRETKIYDTLYCLDENASSVPTKLFLYGPPNSYDWFMHDDESDTSAKIAALDVFHCPDEFLPMDESLLPILTIAVLESAGRPLVSPPNIPHAVISVNDCVMVEQRRVCNLFLEEVAYFLEKCKTWHGSPIIYQYVSEQLQSESVVRDDLIPRLVALFDAHDAHNNYHLLVRQRIASQLFTLAHFPSIFKLSDDGRQSLLSLIRDKMDVYLDTPQSLETKAHWTPRQRLLDHWDVKTRFWPKPGCVFAPPRNIGSAHLTNPVPGVFLPVVYPKGIPAYGCEKSAVEQTAAEYHHMAKLCKADADSNWHNQALNKYLKSVKAPKKDELLDELF